MQGCPLKVTESKHQSISPPSWLTFSQSDRYLLSLTAWAAVNFNVFFVSKWRKCIIMMETEWTVWRRVTVSRTHTSISTVSSTAARRNRHFGGQQPAGKRRSVLCLCLTTELKPGRTLFISLMFSNDKRWTSALKHESNMRLIFAYCIFILLSVIIWSALVM